MITRQDLKEGTKLKVKQDKSQLGADAELIVCFPGDTTVVVKTQDGKEIQTDYVALTAMYDVVPDVLPTRENFMPRALDDIELCISHLTAFTQSSATNTDNNILAIGSKLYALKEELSGYVVPVADEGLTDTELALRTHGGEERVAA